MKKKLSLLMAAALAACLVMSGCSKGGGESETKKKGSDKEISIGVTVMTLANTIWAETCTAIEDNCKENGWKCTVVDCSSTAQTQITQVENFIQKGVDAIVINPTDQAALETVMKEAMDAGIKVISWDIDSDAADCCLLVDNYNVGYEIGKQAADWIEDNLDGKAEVCILDYPEAGAEVIKRADGINDAITELSPNSKVVAQVSHQGSTDGGMQAMENVLQSNPDCRVVCSVGDGGAMGANEALKAAGIKGEEAGIFSADGTTEFLSKIAAGEPCKMSILLDDPLSKAASITDTLDKLLKDEKVEKDLYTNVQVIDESNLSEYYK
ncbi:sugar ABC transporter substrate-binding protein [[Clostridium] hylemonae]|uniref:sugar ABC transporter substrate-binding protein n=1 Tax=[Clostridium] hylemonae TaxID=89153 RepID=UPI0011063E48|nr:sugar ABC transporter substrate-binding protein [[Clostridium] hylemonae]